MARDALRKQARKAVLETWHLVRVALELLGLLALIALPWLFRSATVAALVWATAQTYPALYRALGGDAPAALVALVLVLMPPAGALGYVQASRVEPWGAFLAAAVATYVLGLLARWASPVAVALAVGAGLVGTVIYLVHDRGR